MYIIVQRCLGVYDCFPYYFHIFDVMAKQKPNISTPTSRSGLTPRPDPYWGLQLRKGCHLGYRARANNQGTWIIRTPGKKRYEYSVMGNADEYSFDQAQDEARKRLKLIGRGGTGDPPTLKEACASYVEFIRHNDKKVNPEATAKDTEGRFRRLIDDDPLGEIRLDHILFHDIEKWWHDLEGSKSSRNRNLAAVKAAVHRAIKVGDVTADAALPWRQVEKYDKADKQRDVYLTREQRRALIDACEGNLRDFVEAVALTGCRPGDLRAVTEWDYNSRIKTVTFRAKTGYEQVPLSDAAHALFSRLAKRKTPLAYLFVRDNGIRYKHREWTKPFKAAAEKALPKALAKKTVMYALRHSFITDAIEAGMPVFEVARATRTSPEMIHQHYAHLLHESVREKLNAVPML